MLRKLWNRCSPLSFYAAVLLAATSAAAKPADAGDLYTDRVKPLLADKCIACHGPIRSEAGLRLDAAVLIRKGGDAGAIVSPVRPASSVILERLTTTDKDKQMPPDGEGVRLKADEVSLIEKWIADGLPAPADETYVASPREHWSYQAVLRPALPIAHADNPINDAVDANAIDRLLSALQETRGLERVEPADRATWLRRVTLDLTGLPPTVEEQQRFLSDDAPDARDRVVDRLLARPAHGERWGRHWMDVWRYSDWDGYKEELRGSQRHIWHWRDWIIESLNADKPYDQMVVEMLAADEAAPQDTNALRATGFLARNYHRSNRNIWLDATVEHTAKAFLGMTIACARCHEHKYDPISQEDYYHFRAIFEPHEVRTEQLAGQPDVNKAGIPRAFDAKPEAKTFVYVRGNEKQPKEDQPMAPGVPATFDHLPYQANSVRLPRLAWQPALSPIAEANALEAAWQKYDNARKAAEAKLKTLRQTMTSQSDLQALSSSAEKKVESKPENKSGKSSENKPERKLENKPNDETKQAISAKGEGTLDPAALDPAALDAALESIDPLSAALLESHAAEAELIALRARYAADRGKAASLPEEQLKPLVHHAAVSEQRASLLSAQLGVQTAMTALQNAKASEVKDAKKRDTAIKNAEKTLQTRREALTKTREAATKPATSYTPVGTVYPEESTGRRLALARWIVDPRNPLTARVAVNHIWLRHFNSPLVEDVSDFGLRSKRPMAQPILDWLAADLVDSGWDMKRLHRQIVLSETYALSSELTGDAAPADQVAARQRDSENRFYWRASVRRLDAEEIRDSLLAVSEQLDRAFSGPDLPEADAEKVHRRSVYIRHAYEKQAAMLVLFDGASPNECYRRSPSILPQQALALSNSSLARELSRKLGQLLQRDATGGDQAIVQQLFMRVLNRLPDDQELATCVTFLADSGNGASPLARQQSLAHALINHNDFVVAR